MSEAAIPKSSPTKQTGRIGRRFAKLAAAGEMGLVAYITAGDPSLEATEKIVLAAAEAGADVIELVKRIRARSDVPLMLFSYFNPILQMGLEKFADAAAAAGADGVLATDLTPEEAGEYRAAIRGRGLDTIFLAAPTSTDARLAKIAEFSSGFLYLISRTGVTGERSALPEDLPELARRVRQFTKLPLAVGFGISQPTHVAVLGGIADAAVVGSALVAEIEKAVDGDAAAAAVAGRIRVLKQAAREGISRRGGYHE